MHLIRTGHGLWSQLIKRAALDLRRYDKNVASDFRRILKLPEKGSIVECLKERKVPPEPVLGGFFGSIQPFTQMFRDILSLVEWAGKNEGKENLRVQFDFEEGKRFKLDLENFREQVERFSTAIRPLVIERWNNNRLGILWGAFGDYDSQPYDVRVKRWSEEYRGGHWPEKDLDPPQFNDTDLDELISRAWQVRRATVEMARTFSPDPAALARIRGGVAEELILENGVPVVSDGAMQTIARLHSDHWAESVAAMAYARAEEARTNPSLIDNLKQKLSAVLNDPPPERRDVEEAVREVEEILKLPIWQRRYELYSIWVLTQIVDALGGPGRFKFELEGDTFHIPFSPKLLATVQDSQPPVRIWGEVRYALRSPRGKGRVSGMQPDYTLTVDTREPPEEAFALVECKQYLRASAKNFRAALTDYATGQPNADVALVNYGPVGPLILKGIPARLLPRVRAIGNFRPLHQDYAREFGEWLRALVEKHTAPLVEDSVPTAQLVTTGALGTPSGADFARIELRWGESPRDLDLHVFIPVADGGWRDINFMWPGTLEEWPWARLEGDVTTGSGPEVIIVHQAVPGLYRITVQLYSHDASLAGSNAVLTLHMNGGTVRRFDCPATGDGVWWHVCDVDFLAPLVTEVNLICHSPFYGDPA